MYDVMESKINFQNILFLTQICIALFVILVSIINLSVPSLAVTEKEQNYWKIVLGSTIGYLFPNPQVFKTTDAKENSN